MGEWTKIIRKVADALRMLYENDLCLFERNFGRGLSERCIVFRFAHYLQDEFQEHYVDCDFNSSSYGLTQQLGKMIHNTDGTTTKRFIDIIIHKRDFNSASGYINNFVCFEIKKWNNKTIKGIEKDHNNLKVLTSDYCYKYGFHIILGKRDNETTMEVFERNEHILHLTWEQIHAE